jgi:hypothetical protein
MPPRVLSGHGLVTAFEFAPAGNRAAFLRVDASLYGSLYIWDLLQDSAPPVALSGPISAGSVGFAPDGNRIALWGNSVMILPLWSATADYLCTRVWRNFSMDDWKLYIGEGIPYERTCPNLPPGAGVPKF